MICMPAWNWASAELGQRVSIASAIWTALGASPAAA
jgi:hypothetical protein